MLLEFKLSKSPSQVFEVLSDMQKFVAVHPVISLAQPLGNESYKLHETLRFAGIPFSFKYIAVLVCDPLNMRISMKATVFFLVNIHIQFEVQDELGKTRVKEQVDFKSVLPFHFLLRSVFTEQHTKLFAAIEKL